LARFVILLLLFVVQKKHSRNGNSTEGLARGAVDELTHHNLTGFFDVDHLTSISTTALTASIRASCVICLFLDTETHLSTWVLHELEVARQHHIGCIVIIDNDRYNQRDVIDQVCGTDKLTHISP
jgi:hypothetical protein